MSVDFTSKQETHERIKALVDHLELKTRFSSRASDILNATEFTEIVGYGEASLGPIAGYVNSPNYGFVARLAFQQITKDLKDPVVYPDNLRITLEECQAIDKRWLTINGYISAIAV